MLDLNHGSGAVYGGSDLGTVAARLNRLLDDALLAERQGQPSRQYLGASRIGEPCARRLA